MRCQYRDRELTPCTADAVHAVVFRYDDGAEVGPCYYCQGHAPKDGERLDAVEGFKAKRRRVSISVSPVRTTGAEL